MYKRVFLSHDTYWKQPITQLSLEEQEIQNSLLRLDNRLLNIQVSKNNVDIIYAASLVYNLIPYISLITKLTFVLTVTISDRFSTQVHLDF